MLEGFSIQASIFPQLSVTGGFPVRSDRERALLSSRAMREFSCDSDPCLLTEPAQLTHKLHKFMMQAQSLYTILFWSSYFSFQELSGFHTFLIHAQKQHFILGPSTYIHVCIWN